MLARIQLSASGLLGFESLESRRTPQDCCVYLSGSLVEGLGNAGSDVDVFVVGELTCAGTLTTSHAEYSAAIHFHQNRRVDFQYWSPSAVERLAGRVDALRADGRGEALDEIAVEFLDRLRIGLPLRGDETLRRLRARTDYERLRRHLVHRSTQEVQGRAPLAPREAVA